MSEYEFLASIPLAALQESKTNPRRIFDKAKMFELVESVKQQGIVVPLVVRPIGDSDADYEIIAGSRRFRAAKEAGLKEVPILIRAMSDKEALELQVIENDQRADVHPMEQCEGYLRLMKEHQLEILDLSLRLGKSVPYVAKRLKFADLIPPLKKMFLDNHINIGHANQLARLNPVQQAEAAKWLKEEDLTVEELANEIERSFFLILKDAPFDVRDEELVKKAGSCSNCPKRTGFNKVLFDDIVNEDTCTDSFCYEEKVRAHIKRQVGTHKDAVLLSQLSWYDDKKAKHLTTWVLAGNKKCENTKEGVIVEHTGNVRETQRGKIGAVVTVCTNPKCKVHNEAHARSSSGYKRPEGEVKKERARKLELKRRALLFNDLATRAFTISDEEWRDVMIHLVERLNADDARALGQAMDLKPVLNHGFRDWRGTVEKHVGAVKDREWVKRWIYLLKLVETDLWFYNNSTVSCKSLEASAKRAGVKLEQIAALAKQKPAKVKQEPKKAKKERAA